MKRIHRSIQASVCIVAAGLWVSACSSSSGDDSSASPGTGAAGGSAGAGGASSNAGGGGASGKGTGGGAGAAGKSGASGESGHSGASGKGGSGVGGGSGGKSGSGTGGGTSGHGGTGNGGNPAGQGGSANGGSGGSGVSGSSAMAGGGQAGASSGDPLDPSLAPTIDTNPSDYPANVWVTDGMAKVQPTAAPGSVHWALLSSAKNESESFQVHVQAATSPINLNVTVSDLVDAKSGTTIAAQTNVSVFREAYLDITTLSDQNGTLGKTPDPLIPVVDSTAHEARNAFPVMVPQNETRSAWVDVFVPPSAASGYYTGTVTVTDGATTLATLPIQLAVWDFTLPSTSSLRSGFGLSWNGLCVQGYGSYDKCSAYPGATSADDAIEKTHIAEATMFLDYRVSLGEVVYAPVTDGDFSHFDSLYGPLLGGTAATQRAGAEMTGIWFTGDDTKADQLTSWQQHFAAMSSWSALSAAYYCDEPPNGCSWSQALSQANAIHAAAPGMPTLLTTDYAQASQNGLLGAVDVLVSIVEEMDPRDGPNARSSYDSWLAMQGKHLWWYQSCDEHESCSNGTVGGADSTWPSYMVDATPTRNRVFQWLAYLNKIEGELYYGTDICWGGQKCGDKISGDTTDPWVSIYAFGGNGDGTLFYPGTPAKIGGTTPVPVPSLRLALIRDGMEDFEYLHALDASGDGAFAQSTAATFITSSTKFDNDPTAMQSARQMLGARLHHQVHP